MKDLKVDTSDNAGAIAVTKSMVRISPRPSNKVIDGSSAPIVRSSKCHCIIS